MNSRAAIQVSLLYLANQQLASGGFMGQASSHKHDFVEHRLQPTVFFTALILTCLRDTEGSEVIRRSAADFVLVHKSASWTWNYWMRGVHEATAQPYPDDLDDTCCAIIGLYHYQPSLVDGTVLGYLAQSLVSCETALGGPYETWLVNRGLHPDWHDVDLAVNTNIGYCLSLQAIELPGLMSYIEQQLASKELRSTYYEGELPNIYFLARWYKGAGYPRLQAKIINFLSTYDSLDALMLSLLISSACAIKLSPSQLKPLVDRLMALRIGDHWTAAAFYGEPAVHGVAYYAGSAALTTAFAVEALTSFAQLRAVTQATLASRRSIVDKRLQSSLRNIRKHLPSSELKTEYNRFVNSILSHDSDHQITGMASITAEACGQALPADALNHLNLASLHGWIAYTIYDNFWDGHPSPLVLGVANLSLRQVTSQFQLALPDACDYQNFVNRTLQIVDAADTWEYSHARAEINGEIITIARLPRYAAQRQLAARSWGHLLAASGTLLLAGHAMDSPEQQALRQFFEHFLIARQLNDDAHDWEDDLRRGQLSAVVCLLLRDRPTPLVINLNDELESLRVEFWQQTIDKVVKLIKKHVVLARQALANCPFTDSSHYESWLSAVEAAASSALSERQQTQAFIASYST